MTMGRSAGRSRGNRLGEGAARRATPRQRDLVDPPRIDQLEEAVIRKPGRRVELAFGAYLLLLAILGSLCVTLIILTFA